MSWAKYLIILIAYRIIHNAAYSPMEDNKVVLKKVVSNFNPEMVNLTVSLTKPDGLLNLVMDINPLSDGRNIFVKLTIQKRSKDDLKFQTFLNINNITLDYCGYANGHGLGSYLIDILAKNLENYGNLIQRCPLRGHVYLKNYQVDLTAVPFVLPRSEYSFRIIIYTSIQDESLFVADIIVLAELKRK